MNIGLGFCEDTPGDTNFRDTRGKRGEAVKGRKNGEGEPKRMI
ncbi:hypothetical protein E2C01_102205 [Portunus trituberculatus]|uniref:Uncharacterized protein n=1 Tax=Portunus trituberculatus TaxID=210409 RepID=A0A5B7KNN5_PORTR|nr:hypothetical protein [Portunus trituberculatus]